MKRVLLVEVSGVIEVQFDDDIHSDFDDRTLLEIGQREGSTSYTQREILSALAYSLGVLNSWDGYADFEHSRDRIHAWDFVGGPEFGKVTLDDKVII